MKPNENSKKQTRKHTYANARKLCLFICMLLVFILLPHCDDPYTDLPIQVSSTFTLHEYVRKVSITWNLQHINCCAKFRASFKSTSIPNFVQPTTSNNCVCMLGKLLASLPREFCPMVEPPEAHIMQNQKMLGNWKLNSFRYLTFTCIAVSWDIVRGPHVLINAAAGLGRPGPHPFVYRCVRQRAP